MGGSLWFSPSDFMLYPLVENKPVFATIHLHFLENKMKKDLIAVAGSVMTASDKDVLFNNLNRV